jgi:hypothetical protein
MQVACLIGALTLLAALSYGASAYRERDKCKAKMVDQLVRDRSEKA